MIHFTDWKSCIEEPPEKNGEYLVVRFDECGNLAYACSIHYTTRLGWNTYEGSREPSKFFGKDDEYDRECLWAEVTRTEEKDKPNHWEFVMFDSATGISHDVVCPVCRKPRAQVYINYCAYCGADMREENKE